MDQIDKYKDALLLLMRGKVVAYHVEFANISGGARSGLFLSQLFYWWGKGDDKDEGWVYKIQQEWEEETGLTRYEQETARKKLKELNLIEEELRGMPAQLYYKPNFESIVDLLAKNADEHYNKQVCWKTTYKDVVKPHTSKGKSNKQGNPPKPIPAVASTVVEEGPENTTEITTENHHQGTVLTHLLEEDDDNENSKEDYQQEPIVESLENQQDSGREKAGKGESKKARKQEDKEYFLSIEQHLDRKDIHCPLVGLSFQPAKKMYEASVPLELVLRTIDEVKANAKNKVIRSFKYFESAIWENFNRRKMNSGGSEASKTKALLARLRKERQPAASKQQKSLTLDEAILDMNKRNLKGCKNG